MTSMERFTYSQNSYYSLNGRNLHPTWPQFDQLDEGMKNNCSRVW